MFWKQYIICSSYVQKFKSLPLHFFICTLVPENYKMQEFIQDSLSLGDRLKMPKDEKDYSDYIGWMHHQSSTYVFICGFTFTILTLLVINLPNPNTILTQSIMLFITILFDLLLYVILLIGVESLQFCKDIPPFGRSLRLCNFLSDLVIVLWGFSVPLIFLLWNIVYLAVLSTIIWIIFILISNFTLVKPFKQYRKILKVKRDTE
jgi:hypothetical protein